MSTQKYTVTPYSIETLLSWVKSKEIALPEIQRPFVWDSSRVRDFLDSLYKGYPVGYLIVWRNPKVRLKDGSYSREKRILIDGQQRITSLMTSLLGYEVFTEDYQRTRIRIAFDPQEEKFEVTNSAIEKASIWISDISLVFSESTSLFELTENYCEKNPHVNRKEISLTLEKLKKILNNQIGVIELAEDLDIEKVTEIFIRVNSKGLELSQADFAMSRIAANETYGGYLLRRAIDYFCHGIEKPDFIKTIPEKDKEFKETEYYPKISWIKNFEEDIYKPDYTDVLRVAFTSQFNRGLLKDLVAQLAGRNFETKEYDELTAENAFSLLKKGVLEFIHEANFRKLILILRSAGFVTRELISGKNAINFAYVLYILCKQDNTFSNAEIESLVRKWYVLSVLKGRYTGNPDGAFDSDIRGIRERGIRKFCSENIKAELTEDYWTTTLPLEMNTSSNRSPYFLCFLAAQIKQNDKGFLSRDNTVQDLIRIEKDYHHVYPKQYLKEQGLSRGHYNQVANLVVSPSSVNRSIGGKPPEKYFSDLVQQVKKGVSKYGGISSLEELRENFIMNCIPESFLNGEILNYDDFLVERRKLMSLKIKKWFSSL